MRRAIERAAYEYDRKGVNIDLRIGRNGSTFTARLREGGANYERLRNNPFPIKLIEERIEFLNKKLLLIL